MDSTSACPDAFHALWDTYPDEDRLDRALSTVLRRHPALRSTFADTVGDGPVRTVHDWTTLEARWTDLRQLPPAQRAAAARERAERLAAEPFDLARGPLVRVHGCRLATTTQWTE